MKISKTINPKNRAEWRAWLEKHHDTEAEVWLVFYKSHTGKPRVRYAEAVEEALCFGWIDSNIQSIDSERYAYKFTPRKTGSKWSALNKRRVARLMAEGKMTEAGLAKLDYTDAADDYGRTPERLAQELVVPPYLAEAFKANQKAGENFNKLAPSYRRSYIRWITSAKTEGTRERRIKEALELLEQGKQLGLR